MIFWAATMVSMLAFCRVTRASTSNLGRVGSWGMAVLVIIRYPESCAVHNK